MIAIFLRYCPAFYAPCGCCRVRLSRNSRKAIPAMPPKGPPQAAAESALAVDTIDTREFARNMLTVGMKSQKLMLDFIARTSSREDPGPIDPLNISGAMLSLA